MHFRKVIATWRLHLRTTSPFLLFSFSCRPPPYIGSFCFFVPLETILSIIGLCFPAEELLISLYTSQEYAKCAGEKPMTSQPNDARQSELPGTVRTGGFFIARPSGGLRFRASFLVVCWPPSTFAREYSVQMLYRYVVVANDPYRRSPERVQR